MKYVTLYTHELSETFRPAKLALIRHKEDTFPRLRLGEVELIEIGQLPRDDSDRCERSPLEVLRNRRAEATVTIEDEGGY